jgi:hypothetical protein
MTTTAGVVYECISSPRYPCGALNVEAKPIFAGVWAAVGLSQQQRRERAARHSRKHDFPPA